MRRSDAGWKHCLRLARACRPQRRRNRRRPDLNRRLCQDCGLLLLERCRASRRLADNGLQRHAALGAGLVGGIAEFAAELPVLVDRASPQVCRVRPRARFQCRPMQRTDSRLLARPGAIRRDARRAVDEFRRPANAGSRTSIRPPSNSTTRRPAGRMGSRWLRADLSRASRSSIQ